MARQTAVALVVLLLAVAVAGCIGDDGAKVETSADAAQATATAKTGSITGQIVTEDLKELADATVAITNRTGGIEEATTDLRGRFTFNGLAPGQYRLQVSEECCEVATKNIRVVAGKISQANLQLTILSAEDRQVPHVIEQEWEGFLACGVSVGGNSDGTCGNATDPNHVSHKVFSVREGLTEFIAVLDWQPSGTALGEELRFLLHRPGNETADWRCRYFLDAGPPPLVAHVTESSSGYCDDLLFSGITDSLALQFDVTVGGIGATYQQAFILYWYEFYHHIPPSDFSPLRDG